jgi:YHS domain-containing protein
MRILFALLFALGVPALASASPAPSVSATEDGVAIGGHDPVAYFTEGRPVAGSSNFTLRWNGATWRFASAASRARFEGNPEAYAPAFGGYCAWAISQNYIAPGDPLVWRIVDGRLYLNFNRRAQMLWETDLAGAISRGHANWPRVLATAENR